jgi:fluoroquinolone resistance protein
VKPWKQSKKELRKLSREESLLLAEFKYVEELEGAVNKKDRAKAQRLARILGNIERRLVRTHKNLKSLVEKTMKKVGYAVKLRKLEEEIEIFNNFMIKALSKRIGNLPESLKKKEVEWEIVSGIVEDIKRNISAWTSLEIELRKEIETLDKKEGHLSISDVDERNDLINGKGKFEALSREERRDRWNELVKDVKPKFRVIKNLQVEERTWILGFDFSHFTFKGKTKLSGTFYSCNFDGASFENLYSNESSFTNCSFKFANLSESLFDIALWSGCNFESATLDGMKCVGIRAFRCNFQRASMYNVQWKRFLPKYRRSGICHIEDCDFSGSNIKHGVLIRLVVSDCNFSNTIFSGSNQERSSYYRCNFTNTNMERAYLVEVDFRECRFNGAILDKARCGSTVTKAVTFYKPYLLTKEQILSLEKYSLQTVIKYKTIPENLLGEVSSLAA